jgi:alpha-tubulin suppressor-like RCC1 family protein
MEKHEVVKRLGINILLSFLVLLLLVMATRTLAISAQPQVAAGAEHTVGLKSDGTVVAVGRNTVGQCDVGSWRDIVYVAAGHDRTVGVRSDGSLVGAGKNDYGQCDVGG